MELAHVYDVISVFLRQEADARRQIMSNAVDLDMRDTSERKSEQAPQVINRLFVTPSVQIVDTK